MIHSLDSPAYQNPGENLCWRITNGKLELARRCQVSIKNSKKAISQLQNLSLYIARLSAQVFVGENEFYLRENRKSFRT